MSKKKLVIMNLAIMIGLGSSFAIPSAKAETPNIQAEISDAEKDLNEVRAEIAKLNEQTIRVDKAIAENNKKMEQTEQEITTAKADVSEMEDEIADLEESIKSRIEILKQRAVSYQHSGGSVDYFDVLVGSSSFSDFVNRAIAVGKIVEADNNLLNALEDDQNVLKETKAAKVQKLADLTNMKTELEGMHEHILSQKQKNDQLKAELKSEESATLAAKRSLEQQAASVALQETTNSQSSDQEQTTQSKSVELTSGSKHSTSSSSSKKETVAQTPVNSNGTVNDLIRAGNKYIGNSVYVFGGGRSASDIANGRFDCSGFVNWAFSTVGVSLSGNTDTLKRAGTQVSTSNMQPGDLVFFNTYKTDGHVGIYMGGGKFIGSQSSTGVAVANMSSGYWAQKFNGRVVRINL